MHIPLPSDKTGCAHLMARHASRERVRMGFRRMMWNLAWWYLSGMRRFTMINPATGAVIGSYLDENGNLEYTSNELMSHINKTVARLCSMDVGPRVRRKNQSLPMIQQRAVAQVVVDGVVPEHLVERIRSDVAWLFAGYGSCGLAAKVENEAGIGLQCDIEAIHPRELMPFPSLGSDRTKARGLVRERVIPVEHLVSILGSKVKSLLNTMEWWKADASVDQDELNQHWFDSEYPPPLMEAVGGQGFKSYDQEDVVRIRELWLDGMSDTCERYLISSGSELLGDDDYKGLRRFCPVGFSRFFENGTWHGAGMFDLLFGINRELERLLRSLFNNIRDTDRYGVVLMPHGSVNERSALTDVGHGLRVLSFTPDPFLPEFKPTTMQPWNAGALPGQVSQIAMQALQSLSPIQDLVAEKGRIDSATGLQFLDEQIQRALTMPTMGFVRMFSRIYRDITSRAVEEMLKNDGSVQAGELSLDLAGARFDPDTWSLSFTNNPVPNLEQLEFTVRETNPRSSAVRKQEALLLLEKMVTDPDSFKLFCVSEGLDMAMWSKDVENAWLSVVRNILLMYGDGQSSNGKFWMTPETVLPELQYRVLTTFMGGPAMAVASKAVVMEFTKYRQFLLDSMGRTLPNAVPNPDEAAIFTPEAQGMGMPGQGPIPFPQRSLTNAG